MAFHSMLHHLENAPHPPATVLSRSATAALCRVLNALRDGWLLEKRLGHVARMIVEEARAQRLSAEQMLAALMHEWPRVLEVRRVPDDTHLHMLAERLVALCMSEFHAAAGNVAMPVRHVG